MEEPPLEERLPALEARRELGGVPEEPAGADLEPAEDGLERGDRRLRHRGQGRGREGKEGGILGLAVGGALEELEHRLGAREAVHVLPECGPVRRDVRLRQELEIPLRLPVDHSGQANPRFEAASEMALRPACPFGHAAQKSVRFGEEMNDEARLTEPVRAQHERVGLDDRHAQVLTAGSEGTTTPQEITILIA
jgi:hypothetical protein